MISTTQKLHVPWLATGNAAGAKFEEPAAACCCRGQGDQASQFIDQKAGALHRLFIGACRTSSARHSSKTITISSQRQISARSCWNLIVAVTWQGWRTKPYCTGKSADITSRAPRLLALTASAASTISCECTKPSPRGEAIYKRPLRPKGIPRTGLQAGMGLQAVVQQTCQIHGVHSNSTYTRCGSVLKEPSPLIVAFVIAADEINEFFVPQPRTTALRKISSGLRGVVAHEPAPSRIQPQPSVAIRHRLAIWPMLV